MRNFIFCFSVLAQLTSCVAIKPIPPQLEYFQGDDSIYPVHIETIAPQTSKIQKDDILGILVTSKNKESNEIMNFYNINSLPLAATGPGTGGANSQPIGYTIDSLGNVSMPIIGKQKLEGLTLQQAEEKIRIEVEKTLKNSSVNIRFMNHKFTVFGEVGKVGTFNLLNDQTTMIEAIIAAGDISLYGKRDGVKVFRSVNGKRQLGKVNLTNREIFTSPYYYIQNDDIIYVEPIKEKIIPRPQPTPSLFLQRVPIYLGLASTFVSLAILLTRF